MKFFRRSRIYFYLFTFIITVLSLFYYRSLLLPEGMLGKINTYTNEYFAPAMGFATERDSFWPSRNQHITYLADFIESFSGDGNSADSNSPPAVVEPEKIVVVRTESDSQEGKIKESIEKPAKEATEESALEVVEETIPVLATQENDKKISGAVPNISKVSKRDLLITARTAYLYGDVAMSEKYYLELTGLDQDNPDAFGELGNVYYAQGKWNKAGEAYYEAAANLISKCDGKDSQLAYLRRVIKGLDSDLAEKLAQLTVNK